MLRPLLLALALTALVASTAVYEPRDPTTAPERLAAFEPAHADAATYTVDGAHSNFGFRVRHMGVAMVEGEFDTFEGTIHFDPENLEATRADVTVDAASIDTDVERRDDHLRSADFFEVEAYPTWSFTARSAESDGEGAFLLLGDLTIKGETRPVGFVVEAYGPVDTGRGIRAGFHATTTINRRDYGIDWGGDLPNGTPTVDDHVQIVLDIEAVQAAE